MSFPPKNRHPRNWHQAHRQISDKHDALVVKMFDNANSQNRERNLPKTRFPSAPNALFGEKARPRTTNKACLHRKRNLFWPQKSLDYTTNKACFSRYSYRHRLDSSAKQHRNRYKPAHYPKPPILKQNLPRHRFLPGTAILSNQKPTFQSKYKTRKNPKNRTVSTAHTPLGSPNETKGRTNTESIRRRRQNRSYRKLGFAGS